MLENFAPLTVLSPGPRLAGTPKKGQEDLVTTFNVTDYRRNRRGENAAHGEASARTPSLLPRLYIILLIS
jgi:hypothetical protein